VRLPFLALLSRQHREHANNKTIQLSYYDSFSVCYNQSMKESDTNCKPEHNKEYPETPKRIFRKMAGVSARATGINLAFEKFQETRNKEWPNMTTKQRLGAVAATVVSFGRLVREGVKLGKPDSERGWIDTVGDVIFAASDGLDGMIARGTGGETAFGGGSMSTVSYANQYNREVLALSGRFGDKYSQGCNMIIAQNKAKILASFQDVLDELGDNYPSVKQPQLFEPKEIEVEERLKPAYQLIAENSPISLDDLSIKLEMPPFKLLPILLDLELLGYINALSGKQYAVA